MGDKRHVKVADNLEAVFDWNAFDVIRNAHIPLVLEAAEKLARQAEQYPAPDPVSPRTYNVFHGEHRVLVFPSGRRTHRSNAKHNTLIKVLKQMGE